MLNTAVVCNAEHGSCAAMMQCMPSPLTPFFHCVQGDQGGPVVANFGDPNREPLLVAVASGNDHNCVGVEW